MSDNPYESPHVGEGSSPAERNLVGLIGFFISLTGVSVIALVGPFGDEVATFGMGMAFLCMPGFVLSVIGLFFRPRRLAVWGVAMGVFGGMYLPTFCLDVFIL